MGAGVLQFVLGKGGVTLMLIIVFMAVTSAGSAEMMAVSTLFTYDIYKACRAWPHLASVLAICPVRSGIGTNAIKQVKALSHLSEQVALKFLNSCAQAYIRPKATGKELLIVTRVMIFSFGLFTGALSIILDVVRPPCLPVQPLIPSPASCAAHTRCA
jgi:hypothetical protein